MPILLRIVPCNSALLRPAVSVAYTNVGGPRQFDSIADAEGPSPGPQHCSWWMPWFTQPGYISMKVERFGNLCLLGVHENATGRIIDSNLCHARAWEQCAVVNESRDVDRDQNHDAVNWF